MTGTLTRKSWSMAMRLRSTCSSAPLTGSACQSTIIALPESPPALRSKMVVVSGFRTQDALHLLGIDRNGQRLQSRAVEHGRNQSFFAQAAGIVLVAALPRLGFNVFFLRCCSHNFVFPLQKQSADRRLFVNRFDGRAIKPAIDNCSILGSLRAASVSGMVLVTTTLTKPGLRNSLDGRTRQYRVRGASVNLLRARVQQCLAGLHQRSGGIDNVVEDDAGTSFDVADHVHHLGFIHSVRRLSTMARAESIFLAKKRARSTPPASGETTVRSGRFKSRK